MNEDPAIHFHGVELRVREVGGAKAVRVLHSGGQTIDAHQHDWVCITLPVIGNAREFHEGGDVLIDGPAAILHPAGSYHGDEIGSSGLETFSIQFDPAWLRDGPDLRRGRSRIFDGGRSAAAASRLAVAWSDPRLGEAQLKAATLEILSLAAEASPAPKPAWLERVKNETSGADQPTTAELAQRLDLHPAWLARSYRLATGEGLADMRRRRRVTAAVVSLREGDETLADIAVAAGFCDQSHMNRNFLEVLGRTPLQVRQERLLLQSSASRHS